MKNIIKAIKVWRLKKKIRKTWVDFDICPNDMYRDRIISKYAEELKALES